MPLERAAFAYANGFHITDDAQVHEGHPAWQELRELWITAILTRQFTKQQAQTQESPAAVQVQRG